jgi:hypothetical protein
MEVVSGVRDGQIIEDYPEYAKGPCVLVLQRDLAGVVTAYRPDLEKSTLDFLHRRDR